MFFIIGFGVVIGSVLGGYVLHGGNLGVLYQPTEYLIIGGAGIGAFIVANPSTVLKKCMAGFKLIFKSGAPFKKSDYIELLKFMFETFKFMKTQGMLKIEEHIEDPHNSDLFSKYPSVVNNHHAIDFICDYLRLMTMGVDDRYQLEDLMDAELDKVHHEQEEVSLAIMTFGDSFPALGIVAAVLGIIITMGSITEPPEILGGLIAAALVGTFLGIFLAYGVVGPMGQFIGKYYGEEHQFVACIKVALIAHVMGNAPTISVEYARKAIPGHVMPSFAEVEEALSEI